MITFEQIQTQILKGIESSTEQFERIFHGRGHCYEGYEFLTIDSIDKVLSIAYFKAPDEAIKTRLQTLYATIFQTGRYDAILLQHRYLDRPLKEVLFGTLPDEVYAYEEDMRFTLNLHANQNNGYFGDMRNGRAYVKMHSQNKKVLNLFAYTCAFSVAALKGGATQVVNVDMSKKSLEIGRENHRLNGLDIRGCRFMPYNILKSWSRIKKAGPYDLIIIDPPSFQKGSFESTKDYQKIVKRLNELATPNATVLACLNNPRLESQFVIDLFTEFAPSFVYKTRLENVASYCTHEDERALKNLIFEQNV